jgi:hypothetical protein
VDIRVQHDQQQSLNVVDQYDERNMCEQQDDEYQIVLIDIIRQHIQYVQQAHQVVVHVVISQRIHIIQVMQLAIVVVGHVILVIQEIRHELHVF